MIVPRDHGDVAPLLECMRRSLAHRGPDSQGAVIRNIGDWTVGLTHTRLAILDLTPAGRQPMHHPAASCWITYNGETYNFAHIRAELEKDSNGFRSNTDTEVILRAYEAWGTEALNRFRGMFALALLDEPKRQLLLARDPLGIKPLYYHLGDKCLVFASEIRALLESGLVPRKISRSGLRTFLETGSVEAPSTILDEVQALLPGHCATVRLDDKFLSIEEQCYSRGLFSPVDGGGLRSRQEAAQRLRDVLMESVRLHLVSDVPLGVFLSGGIDSSALVGLIRRAKGCVPQTFSVVFAEREFSEATHAKTIAEKFGTDHREILLHEKQLLDLLPAGLKATDQPTMDGTNTFVISKAVKEAGITVALSGLGGDELFGGYPSFRRAAWLARLGVIPVGLRRTLAAFGRSACNGSVRTAKMWDLIGSEADPTEAYAISRRVFADSEIRHLLASGDQDPRTRRESGFADVFNAVSELELRGFMANTLLRDADFMSMAHALEVRVPFVDIEVVRFVLSVPGHWKTGGSRPKPLLLEALDGLLPESVWRRRKMGFTLPLAQWMRSQLRHKIGEAFFQADGLRAAGLDAKHARAFWIRFLENPEKERWARPWALFVLDRWCADHRVTV